MKAMEVEAKASLDERVAEFEEWLAYLHRIVELETFKGKKTLVDAQRVAWEVELKQHREQQELAWPLPARLQAAKDRLAKCKLHREEILSEKDALEKQLRDLIDRKAEAEPCVLETFWADNTLLQAENASVSYRLSKDFVNRDFELVRWGCPIVGIDCHLSDKTM